MHASASGGAAVGGPWGWDLNGLLLQLQGNESFGELDGAWNESKEGAVGASDGNSSDMDDVEELFEEHQSGCLDAFAFASTSHIPPIIDTARELVMEHDPEQLEDTTIDVEPTQNADGQGPPPTQVLTQCIDELK
ncbi:hypothetical protein L7F22_061384, partial [Adiantum nelumboides]|nr:hypothetical protein [Adiantum nelumboides]